MRNVVLYLAMSLDGYLADKNGGVDWLGGDGSDPAADGSYPAFYETIDTVVMGWNTYHQIITELSPDINPYQGKKCYVFTHRELENTSEFSFVSKPAAAFLAELRQQPGKDIWICGGANLVQQLIQADQIDQYCISVIPTLLGGGIPVFPQGCEERPLKLVRTESYNGITDLVYVRR